MWRCGMWHVAMCVAMWRCGDVAMWRCGDVAMWRCGMWHVACGMWHECGTEALGDDKRAPFGALGKPSTRRSTGADDGIRTRDPHLGKGLGKRPGRRRDVRELVSRPENYPPCPHCESLS